jgi:uncharacterized hydrophobic protein (TIGR00271 family)
MVRLRLAVRGAASWPHVVAQDGSVPLLRITCPADRTEGIVEVLNGCTDAGEVAVTRDVGRSTGGDLILAQVPRASVDRVLADLAPDDEQVEGLHVTVLPSEQLYPPVDDEDTDDEAVIWAQVALEVHETGRLSVVNVLLVVIAASIAAVGVIADQLLLIVGAMALSPEYYPVVSTSLAVVQRDRAHLRAGLRALTVSLGAGIVGAAALAGFLGVTGMVEGPATAGQQLTRFISRPDELTVVVAILAGAAGALAITLPDARGLVGVFMSITTIPAAANICVAAVSLDWPTLGGAAVQLGVNVICLLAAGTLTLALRARSSG